MKKFYLHFKQTLLVILVCGGMNGWAQTTFVLDDVTYTLNEGDYTCAITDCSESKAGDLYIPSLIEHNATDYMVTNIGNSAFEGCSALTSVTIPENVTSIGAGAFSGCFALTNVDIPSSVTNIGSSAFSTCYSLTYIRLPESVSYIGDGTFYGCFALARVNIPSSVTNIGSSAFSSCHSLRSISLPENVTSIGKYAFHLCSALASVNIPESVKSIGDEAFSGCSALTSIIIPEGVEHIGESTFQDCPALVEFIVNANNLNYTSHNGLLLNKDKTELLSIIGTHTSVTIPESVMRIGNGAFNGHSALTSVTIHEGVTSIGSYAFSNCSGLTSVEIPSSVTSIGSSAFYNCSGLTSVTIHDGVTSIGEWAFEHCSGLTSIVIPNSVTNIGSHAFSNCSSLTSITIPENVTSIGDYAFSGCSAMTEFIVDTNNTNYASHDGLLLNKGKTELIEAPDAVTSVTIPGSVTSIASCAFYDCSSLTSVTIPENVTSIGERAFSNCSSLTSITIPENVTSIGDYAFSGCSAMTEFIVNSNNPFYASHDGLLLNKEKTEIIAVSSTITSVVIPSSITNIRNSAFNNNSALTEFVVNSNNSNYASHEGLLLNKAKTKIIAVPEAITSVIIPSSVTELSGYAFSSCFALTEFIVDKNNPYYASYEGLLLNKSKTEILAVPRTITSVYIPSSVTKIVSFSDCSSLTKIIVDGSNPYYASHDGLLLNKAKTEIIHAPQAITTANIPEGVIIIGWGAFQQRTALTSITIPRSVKAIATQAFCKTPNLTTITIPTYVTTFGSHVFSDCPATVEFMGKIPPISSDNSPIFRNYLGTHIVVPSGCGDAYRTACPDVANKIVEALSSTTSDNVTYELYSNATCTISDCKTSKAGETVIPVSINYNGKSYAVTYIRDNAFDECSSLTSITIPDCVKSIGNFAFSDCAANIEFKSTTPPLGSYAIFENYYGTRITVPSSCGDAYRTAYPNVANKIVEATLPTYEVRWIVDGEVIKIDSLKEGQSIIYGDAPPTKEGYTFSGWSEIPKTMPANNIVITGSFTLTTGILGFCSTTRVDVYNLHGQKIATSIPIEDLEHVLPNGVYIINSNKIRITH